MHTGWQIRIRYDSKLNMKHRVLKIIHNLRLQLRIFWGKKSFLRISVEMNILWCFQTFSTVVFLTDNLSNKNIVKILLFTFQKFVQLQALMHA